MVLDAGRLASCAARGEADLVEIFSSIQGEGPRAGERHLFVRLSHCDIHCAYCDTPLCHVAPATGRWERTSGRRDWIDRANPVPVADVGESVAAHLRATRHAAVSFTGGEPLLQPWVIAALSAGIRSAGVRVLLETDGNLPGAFESVRDAVDIVSMDWKLPSATGEPARYEEHRRFLELARGLETYVKAVFVPETPVEEVMIAVRAVAEVRPEIPFILQPCTPMRHARRAPSPEHALVLQEAASAVLADVRVLPQIHRFVGLP